jgi:putative DNA primase/helicase
LLAIADAARGVWPARARGAAVVLHASREQDDSLGLRLLSDVRLVFDSRGVERISTADLIAALQANEEGPWASERSPLTPHRLARLLHPFEIASKQLRVGSASLKGYEREAFVDAWDRYLPNPPSPVEPKHRNSEHEASFDVSDGTPSDGDSSPELVDLPVEQDYPRSAWDPDAGEDDPAAERSFAATDTGGAP